MCPRIRTEEEARLAAAAMRYPPEGSRGVAMMVRASGFAAHFKEYHAGQRENLVGIVQIETETVLNALDRVAAIEGIDVLFVGPLDLSIALGTHGQPDHPRYWDAVRATADAARKAGKAAGILLLNPDDFGRYHGLGYRLIASGSDSVFVQRCARQTVETLQKMRAASGT
jgi:4-hydroxy-2-oxoheptanedioate aldolase